MAKLKSINPSTYELLREVNVSNRREIENKVTLAASAQKDWSRLGLAGRVRILQRVIADFEARAPDFILLESREMGMPLSEAAVDYQGTLDFARWYLDNAEKYLGPETIFESETEIHQVFREPIGVAAVIIPWNYPFLNFVWGTFQSLIAGNAVVLKHSEECPLSGQFIEVVMRKHMPPGVFSEVYGDGMVGRFLVEQPISMIGFVGSTRTGKLLYEAAGKKFIKAVMELGGSAPAIVFDDADIDAAVRSICEFRLTNCGQYCDGLKRLIVHRNIFDDLIGKLTDAFAARKIGVAEEKNTELGPLVAKRQLDLLVRQVKDAKTKGARVITGGNSLETQLGGAFHEPTIITDVTKEMKVWKEEVFGPVLPVVKFSREDEAIRLANDTTYGLGSYVYTTDLERAQRVARALETGMVSINGTNYTTPWNPFGGYKSSGIGREHGKYGFHELTQVKVIARNK